MSAYLTRVGTALLGGVANTAETAENLTDGVKELSATVDTVAKTSHAASESVYSAVGMVSALSEYLRLIASRRSQAADTNHKLREIKNAKKVEEQQLENNKQLNEKAKQASIALKKSETALLESKMDENAKQAALRAVEKQKNMVEVMEQETQLSIKQANAEKKKLQALASQESDKQNNKKILQGIYTNRICRTFGFRKHMLNTGYDHLNGMPHGFLSKPFWYPIKCKIKKGENSQETVHNIKIKKEEIEGEKIPNPIILILETNYIIRPDCNFGNDNGFPFTNDVLEKENSEENENGEEKEVDDVTVTFIEFTQDFFNRYVNVVKGGGKTRKKNKRKHNKRTKTNRKSKRNTRRRKK